MSIYENDGGAQSAPSAPGAPTMVDAMQTAGGKPALSIPKTKEEWMAARPKIALLVGGFFLVLLCLIGLWPSSETLGDGAPPPPPTGSRGTQSIDGKNYFIHGSPQQIRQNDQQSDVSLPLDYAVGFEFTPTGDVVDSWSNIIHFTATGNDCCNYGDRVPGVWLHPGSRQLYIIDGHGNSAGSLGGDDECVISEALVVEEKVQIRIEMRQKVVDVFLNDEPTARCSEPRADRRPFDNVRVFASDGFYPAANGLLDNFYWEPLDPVVGCTVLASCNHDPRASEADDTACEHPPYGQDCNGNYVRDISQQGATCGNYVSEVSQQGATCFIQTPMLLSSGDTALHAIIRDLPLDYTVSFTITPQFSTQPGWSSIIHFTATGNNCCEYGDRIPGVWFWPNSHRLHVVDGMPDSGNANCSPEEELRVNEESTVVVSIGQGFMDVNVNGVSVCDGVRKDRRRFSNVHVYASDPFYEPAIATINNLVLAPMQPRSGCMIDAACNRDFKATYPSQTCVYPDDDGGLDCTGQHQITVEPDSGTTWFIRDRETPLRKYVEDEHLLNGGSGGLHTTVYIPLDYRVQFEITPDPSSQVREGWSSIFHFTATGANCCEYGDRIPGVWFFPGGADRSCVRGSCPGHRLHVVYGHDGDGNANCSPEDELQSGVRYTITIDIRRTHVELLIDGRMVCTQPRGETHSWSPAHLMMTDPWYESALATINNFKLTHLEPISGCTNEMACNYNIQAAFDDGTCHIPERGFDCEGTRIGSVDGLGITNFIVGPRPLSNTNDDSPYSGQMHAVVALPDDFTIFFTINPHEVVEGWASIFHFTATGSNCCQYGDRIPAVWFKPGTLELYVVDGQPSSGNDDKCDTGEPLPSNVESQVEISIHQSELVLKVDGVERCREARQDRAAFPNVHVYASDPWHTPASATISNFRMDSDL